MNMSNIVHVNIACAYGNCSIQQPQSLSFFKSFPLLASSSRPIVITQAATRGPYSSSNTTNSNQTSNRQKASSATNNTKTKVFPNGQQRQGTDVHTGLKITFEDAMLGTDCTFNVSSLATCSECNGSRCRPGSSPIRCEMCIGTGSIVKTTETFEGLQSMRVACPGCSGQGCHVYDECSRCSGTGLAPRTKQVRVMIPAGVDTSTTLKVAGEGNQGVFGGPSGDLYVRIQVEGHSLIRRSGVDLYSDVHVPIWDAMLGGSVDVPTVYGDTESLDIPPGCQHESTVSIKGQGAVDIRRQGRKGDHYFSVKVRVPTQIGPEEERLLKKLAELQKMNDKKNSWKKF